MAKALAKASKQELLKSRTRENLVNMVSSLELFPNGPDGKPLPNPSNQQLLAIMEAACKGKGGKSRRTKTDRIVTAKDIEEHLVCFSAGQLATENGNPPVWPELRKLVSEKVFGNRPSPRMVTKDGRKVEQTDPKTGEVVYNRPTIQVAATNFAFTELGIGGSEAEVDYTIPDTRSARSGGSKSSILDADLSDEDIEDLGF